MKLSWFILVLLIAMCVVLAITLSIPEKPQGYDFTHPDFTSMQRGPDGMERNGPVLWLGLSFAILQFCIFASLIALSLNKQGRLSKFKKPLLVGLFLNIAVFSSIIIAYLIYARDGTETLIGSFPWPTALMLYGLGPIQIVFAIIYIWYFDRAIFTAEDLEKFQQLVNARRQHMEGEN